MIEAKISGGPSVFAAVGSGSFAQQIASSARFQASATARALAAGRGGNDIDDATERVRAVQ
jgi:hypothetical protein